MWPKQILVYTAGTVPFGQKSSGQQELCQPSVCRPNGFRPKDTEPDSRLGEPIKLNRCRLKLLSSKLERLSMTIPLKLRVEHLKVGSSFVIEH